MSKRAVFLDRDGTLIEDTGFIRRVEDVRLIPDAAEAVRRLNASGWAVIVVSNQSGVARGLLTERDVHATNERMMELLKKEGARIDAIYCCPHLLEGRVPNYAVVCECRKPKPGMLLKAAKEHDIDLANSVTIGDAPRDAEAGLAAGTRAILLTDSPARADQAPDACGQAPDLLSAVREILEHPFTATAPVPAAEPPAPPPRREPAATPDEERPTRASARRETPAKTEAEEPAATPAVPEPQKQPAVPAQETPIPIRRAPKEFTPEPEVPENGTSLLEEPSAPEPPPVDEVPAAEPPRQVPAAPVTFRCTRCGRPVGGEEVETGKAFVKDDVTLCGECVAILQAQKVRPRGDFNEDLLRELKNITRALTYERFSYWHVFGAIVQALALGSLVFSFVVKGFPEGLLCAIFFQLLALTFFILGRQ